MQRAGCALLRWAVRDCFVLELIVLCVVVDLVGSSIRQAVSSDNEFAEFEEFDDVEHESNEAPETPSQRSPYSSSERDTPPVDTGPQSERKDAAANSQPPNLSDTVSDEEEYGVVEEEEADFFSYTADAGLSKEHARRRLKDVEFADKSSSTLKIADVPARLRRWQEFSAELAVISLLAIYLVNYAYGKTKNYNLAFAWLEANREILAQQFTVLGNNDGPDDHSQEVLVRESDSTFIVWCSGRPGCIGMLVQLKLLKRQDLLSVIFNCFKPKLDSVRIKITLAPNEMDPIVFALGQKKTMSKYVTESSDLGFYCNEKGGEKFGLPADFVVYAEQGELITGLLDSKLIALLNKYKNELDSVHISDQYSAAKYTDSDVTSKIPATSKVVMFTLNVMGRLGATEEDFAALAPLSPFVFYVLDKVRRFRLSREAKQKAEKNRQRVQESFLKTTHAQRQEAAQQRREEKARERKERLMAEEDPDRQRRLEKQELKRQMKRTQPRMKQLKIKAV